MARTPWDSHEFKPESDSIAMLVAAIQQAGPYAPGHRAEVHFSGYMQGGHGWASGSRQFTITLSLEDSAVLLQEPSFKPIFHSYGINPAMIDRVDAYTITVQYKPL
jgi:hypothetical protein